MTTPELIDYLKIQISKNIPENILIEKLRNIGWRVEDIKEGLLEVSKIKIPKEQEKKDKEIKVLVPKPVAKINSNIFNTPTIPSINTELGVTKAENEELIPSLIPKKDNISSPSTLSAKEQATGIFEKQNKAQTFFTDEINSQKLRETAMISSFPKDSIKENDGLVKKKNRTAKISNFIFSKKFIFTFIIILLLAGGFWVIKKEHIKLPQVNNLLMQESSSKLLSNSPNILSSLLSYKSETKINIIFTPSQDLNNKNSTLINVTGVVNQKGLPTSSADNVLTIQNTNLKGNFVTNLKNTGSILFIPIADLNQFLIKKSTVDGMLAVKEEDFDLIRPLLPEDLKTRLKNSNTHKFLSEELSSYLDDKVIQSYKEYINSLDVKSKKIEVVQGVETYNYDLNKDQIEIKKLLNQIDNIYSTNKEEGGAKGEKGKFDLAEIDSFEVWVSKESDTLFKYRIIFSLPVSAVKNLYAGDKGEGQVKIDWQTTYYDFGVLNKIKMPEKIIKIDDFIKSTTTP